MPDPEGQATSPAMTILVVEDTAVVRAIIVRALREEGYTVVEAEDGETAWGVLGGPTAVNMLITDIVLPDLDGIKLSRTAYRERQATSPLVHHCL